MQRHPEFLRRHFFIALGLGFLLRLCSAYFVYGPQALDDYKHGVWPAYQFFAGLPVNLPEYRSFILVWTLALFTKVGSWFGIESALGQVRVMYTGLALISLLSFFGVYRLAQTFSAKVFGVMALYLLALHPIMPFVSTRAFGEAVAMSLVTFGLTAIEAERRKMRFTSFSIPPLGFKLSSVAFASVGFTALGLAVLYRFQAGLLFVTYGLILVWLRQWRLVIIGFVIGLITLGLQALIDIFSHRPALATLITYLSENEGGGAKYGVMPWYNTWLFVLVLTLFPFSLVFYRRLTALWRSFWPLIVPWFVFVFVHSLVAHKEERFLYPIVGLQLVFLAYVWFLARRERWVQKLYVPVVAMIFSMGLLVTCFANTQEGEIEPPALAQSRYNSVVYLDSESLFGQSRFRYYFLRPNSEIIAVQPEDFNIQFITKVLREYPLANAAILLTSNPETQILIESISGLDSDEFQCQKTQTSGSIVDRILYSLNAKHNQRRRPTWHVACVRKKSMP